MDIISFAVAKPCIIYVELIKLVGNVLSDTKENYGRYDINESFTDVTGFHLANFEQVALGSIF